jgi:flagellar motility protein MotE (MotC chaperone)
MNIAEAKRKINIGLSDSSAEIPIFQAHEKMRASKIAEQLEGMTINEAQEFLARISEAINYVCKL